MDNNLRSELNNYIESLYLYYYIYAEDINSLLRSGKENHILLSDSFINGLERVVIENNEFEFLGEEEKDNIFTILTFLRENYKKDDREKQIERYNNMIIDLHNAGTINDEHFLYDEVERRLICRADRYKVRDSDPDKVKKVFEYDVNVLKFLAFTDDDAFYQDADKYMANEYFFDSLVKYTKEFPQIFEDENIYIRILTILKANSKINVEGRLLFLMDNHNMKKLLIKTRINQNRYGQ